MMDEGELFTEGVAILRRTGVKRNTRPHTAALTTRFLTPKFFLPWSAISKLFKKTLLLISRKAEEFSEYATHYCIILFIYFIYTLLNVIKAQLENKITTYNKPLQVNIQILSRVY